MGNVMTRPSNMDSIERAAALINKADALIVAAGAGMGVDSGLPDFRGKEGFWKAYPALERAQIDFYDIASPSAFQSNPTQAWGFYGHRLALYRRTAPHRGFGLLRSWGEKMLRGYAVFTSNVDGQFQAAGFDPDRIYECHGSIHHLQCLRPCSIDVWSADGFAPLVDEKTCTLRNAAPTCPHCQELARPNVLMFGDWGWSDVREQSQGARLEAWLTSTSRPVVIEIGAGTAIPSVRRFSERVVRQFGGNLVRINPQESRVPGERDVGLHMGAVEALTAIGSQLSPARSTWRA